MLGRICQFLNNINCVILCIYPKLISLIKLSIAKKLISETSELELVKGKNGYAYVSKIVTYGDVKQRWLIVESQARKKSDFQKLDKKIEKSKTEEIKKYQTLQKQKFISRELAESSVNQLIKKFKYHQIDNLNYYQVDDSSQEIKYFQVSGNLLVDENAINLAYESCGRFILATNILDTDSLSDEEILTKYKSQQVCERGFGFIKDPLFFADSIFLKSPDRIETMSMIMGLCLLVYNLAQRQLRKALSSSNSSINNQLGKPTDKPTMRWIFQLFQSIHLVNLNDSQLVSNMNEKRKAILNFLPESCKYYYLC